MRYFIEGGELEGKTTLGQKLAMSLGIPYYHFGENDNKLGVYDNLPKNCVVDRCWVSSYIYDQFMDREPIYSYGDIVEIEQAQASNGIYIYCTNLVHVIISRYKERGDHLFDLQTIKEIKSAYKDFFSRNRGMLVIRSKDVQNLL